MLGLWNHLHLKTSEASDKPTSDFCPENDLWLKIAEASPEEATGTLGFSQF
ncbi:MAG: hypothetical protein AAF298_09955 [Cyanobacteria bacterium P01_A01_bin.40]